MAAPLDAASGLCRAFADFSLLPDLLARAVPGDDAPQDWIDLLDDEGFNLDHVEYDELPVGPDVPTVLADDAWRLVIWLELADDAGLTEAGEVVAGVADFVLDSRTEQVWLPALRILTDRIADLYRGSDGTYVVDLLQAGARALTQAADQWTRQCPGLLLVEIEALLHLAYANPQRAVALVGELEQNRIEAMRGVGPPLAGVVDYLNMSIHSDAVSLYYTDGLAAHVDETVLTLTAAQATVILLVFCGVLEVPEPELPVQYLVAPPDG